MNNLTSRQAIGALVGLGILFLVGVIISGMLFGWPVKL